MDEAARRKGYDDLEGQFWSNRIADALLGIKKTDEGGCCIGEPFDLGDPPDIECKLHRIILTGP